MTHDTTEQYLGTDWHHGLPVVHCGKGEYAGHAAQRRFGDRAFTGFWNRAPAGAKIVGAVSVRQSDPLIPVYLVD